MSILKADPASYNKLCCENPILTGLWALAWSRRKCICIILQFNFFNNKVHRSSQPRRKKSITQNRDEHLHPRIWQNLPCCSIRENVSLFLQNVHNSIFLFKKVDLNSLDCGRYSNWGKKNLESKTMISDSAAPSLQADWSTHCSIFVHLITWRKSLDKHSQTFRFIKFYHTKAQQWSQNVNKPYIWKCLYIWKYKGSLKCFFWRKQIGLGPLFSKLKWLMLISAINNTNQWPCPALFPNQPASCAEFIHH